VPRDTDYGYQIPTAGDESSTQFMPVIEDFCDRAVHHKHDGNDSTILSGINILKTGVDVLASKVVTTATYSNGTDTAILGVTGIVANTYGYNSDLGYGAYVTGVTGNTVIMSSNFTASATGAAITFSNYKKISTSLYERDITLPTGDIAINNNYKFYISSTGSNYLKNIHPTIVDSLSNLVTIQLNDDSLDMKLVLS
jgi:hypothetical protein